MLTSTRINAQDLPALGWRMIADRAGSGFSTISEVKELYVEILENALIFWLFTDDHTDDAALFEQNYAQIAGLMDSYPGVYFDFHIIPLMLCPTPPECTPSGAILVFKRTDG